MHHIIVTELIKSEYIRMEPGSHLTPTVTPFAGVWHKAQALLRFLPVVPARKNPTIHHPMCVCGASR